jgi:hypothetical protein
MAVTRIKANQISDDAVSSAKIAANSITAGKLENNLTYGSNLTISGNLTVNGTTTTVDSTTTQVADPLLLLSRGATGSGSVDGGIVIERGDDDNVAIIWDESEDEFAVAVTSSEDGTTAGNVSITSYANFQAGTVTATAVDITGTFDIDNIRIDGNTVSSTDTNGAINLTPNGTGEVVAATATVSDLTSGRVVTAGTSGALEDDASLLWDGTDLTAGSAIISDLTDNRIVIAGTSGALEDDANLTWDGSDMGVTGGLNVTGDLAVDNIAINGNTVSSTDTNGAINLTPNGTGEVVAASLTVSDLTDNRVVIAGTSGAIEGDSNFTYDGTDLTVNSAIVGDLTDNQVVIAGTAGALEGDSNFTYDGTDLTVNSAVVGDLTNNRVVIAGTSGALEDDSNFTYDGTDLTVNSAVVSDLTDNRVVIAGSSGALEDDANFTFNGSILALTGAMDVTGDLDVDNININGNTIISTDTNGDVNITPNGTGETVIATAAVSDLTSGRIVTAGTSGALEDSSTLLWDGTDLTAGSAIISDLTDNRIVIAGTSGALEDDANLTWDGSDMGVTGGLNVTGDLAVDNIAINGNAITSTDTNGAVTVTPNGTGTIDLGAAATVVNINGTTGSSGTGLGALVVDGGVGIAENLNVGGNIVVTGNLTVEGTTTTVDSTTTQVVDPIFQIGGGAGGAALSADDNKDRGMSAKYYTGSEEKTAFWGFVDSTARWTFVPDATLTSEVVSGSAGAIDVGAIYSSNVTDNRILIAGTNGVIEDDANFTFNGTTLALTAGMDITGDLDVDNININGNTIISTDTNGDINLTPNGTGDVVVSTIEVSDLTSGRVTYASTAGALVDSSNMTFDGTDLTVASAVVSDLTDNRLVVAGTSGALEDDANLTWSGSALAVTGGVDVTGDLDVDNININGNTIISTDTNGDVNITPNGTGETVLSTAAVSDLTDNRVVIAGTSGALEDDANFTYDGTDLTVNSAIISDLTDNRVVIAGTSGALEDDANFTFNGTTLALTAGMDITGDLDVDNINVNGNTIISTDTNGNINLTPNGTGEVVMSTATVSDLTDNRIVIAGTSGALEDDANLTWDGSDMGVTGGLNVTGDLAVDNLALNGNAITSTDTNGNISLTPNGTGETVISTAAISDLTSGRVVLAGTSGAIEDSGNLTFDGTTLTVAGNIAVDNITIDGNDITASSGGVVTVNDAGADVDFRVEGDSDTALFHVDAGNDVINIGTTTATTGAKLKINSTDSVMVPVGTTAQRPGTGVAGMLRVNTSTGKMEYYAADEWKNADAEFTVIASQTFDGDGSTTAFTLSEAQTTASCIVSINGVVQLPTDAYGVSSTTLTFTEAPSTGDKIEVRKLTTTTTVTDIVSSDGYQSVVAVDGTGLRISTGASAHNLRWTFNTDGHLVPNGDELFDIGSASNKVRSLYVGGGTVFLGDLQLKDNGDNTLGVFQSDGVTEATMSIAAENAAAVNLTATNTTDSTHYISFVEAATGTEEVRTDTGLTYNPNSGLLTSVAFAGDLTGDVTGNVTGNADTATTATTATNVTATANNTANETTYITFVDGVSGAQGIETDTGLTYNPSSNTLTTSVFSGTATTAQYADLAEQYASDEDIAAGTVVHFAGNGKVAPCDTDACSKVAGIVSTDPAHLMNSSQEGVPLALAGRVPCKVTGAVNAGDLMVSAGGGLARAEANPAIGTVIGKAIEDFSGEGEGVIEVLALMM